MFAVLLVLLLSAGTVEVMHNGPAPRWVSPTLDEPTYRPGQGHQARYVD